MNQKSKTTPGVGQYLLGFTLAALAITAGGISLAMNFTFGLQTSIIAALVFMITDLCKIVLPMTVPALGGWSRLMKAGYAVAIIMSVMAAVSYLLETQTSRLMASQGAQQSVETAQADAARIRQELTAIGERGDVTTLVALHTEAKAKADREAGRGGCGPKCEATKNNAAQLLARLSQAKRRTELEAQLADAKQAIADTPVTAVGAADNLAAMTGMNRDEIAAHETMVKSFFMLIALEIIAAMSGLASTIVITTFRARKAKSDEKQKRAAKEKKAKPEANGISSKKPAASYWMKRLSTERPDIASRVIAGEISCYEGCIQAGIRKRTKSKNNAAKATDEKWTKIESYARPVEA